MSEILENEIKDRLGFRTLNKNSSKCYVADDGRKLFVKRSNTLNARVMLDGEIESLRHIEATKTIRVPKQYTVIHDYDRDGNSAIVLEYLNLQPIDADTARTLGRDLANLHSYNYKLIRFTDRSSKWIGGKTPSVKNLIKDKQEQVKHDDDDHDDHDDQSAEEDDSIQYSKHQMRIKSTKPKDIDQATFSDKFVPEPGTEQVKEFGFPIPTACGVLPQINDWSENWIEFFARYRLEKPINMLLSEHGDRELIEIWSHLQLKIDKFFTDFDKDSDEHIIPALLHGDLWSGNVGQIEVDSDYCSTSKQAVVYDPSSFYGHNEYDFGIARMFGGIPKAFEEAYFELIPKKKLFERRNKLYQLFHHLNHWNHFGFGYRASSIKIMSDLNKIK